MHTDYSVPPMFVGQRDRDSHFALKLRVGRFKFIDFNDPLSWHELHKIPVVRISVGGRFPHASSGVVSERNSKGTAFTSIKRVHTATLPAR
jgi:hypothetical protein